jgi:predicted dehydrogenase
VRIPLVRLALIGCGEHAQSGHAIPLVRYKADHPNQIELVAACDIQLERAQNFCRNYGFKSSYSNVDELLSHEEINGCIAVVPPEKIAGLGIQLLERRIPCVVEKPLGSSLAEVKALRDCSIASGTSNMVSVNRRFMPFLNDALRWTKSAGPIRYVHCLLARHARTEHEFIWATAVHAVDTLRYIAGDVDTWKFQKIESEKSAASWYTVDLRLRNGAAARLDVLPTAGMPEEKYEIFGEGFRVVVIAPFGERRGWAAYKDGKLAEEEWARRSMPEDVLNGCYDEAAAFIKALRTGSTPQPSIADVAPSVELCLSIAQQSPRTILL